MEDKEQSRISDQNFKPNPRAKSSFLSQLFFCWQLRVVFGERKNEQTQENHYESLREYQSKHLGDKMEFLWLQEETSEDPSLYRALLKLIGWKLLIYNMLSFTIQMLSFIAQPILLKRLLDFYTPAQTTTTKQKAYVYGFMMVVVTFICTSLNHWLVLQLTILGMKMRIACSSLIYRKSLKLKLCGGKNTTGHIVNLLSNDVYRFDTCLSFFPFVWISPLQIFLGVIYLGLFVGNGAIPGFGIIVIFVLFQFYVLKIFARGKSNVVNKTDHRIRLMNDLISGIQAIKLHAWEKPYIQLVEKTRNKELTSVACSNNLQLLNGTIKIYISKICLCLAIVVAVLSGYPLTSQYVFVTYIIYEALNLSVGTIFYNAILSLSKSYISVQKIQEFLLQSHSFEKEKERSKSLIIDTFHIISGVTLKDVTATWESTFALSNVNFEASVGELVGVIGPTGSGKTTLLHVILNELSSVTGKIHIKGSVSYAAQEPWIFSASVRQNILFGQNYDFERYKKVIEVCALEHDISLFPYGDQTLVGDRGVLLNESQKARISLARAIYRNADIYLLDDPLSAVETHIARHIFTECILGYLATKCVVLVTHQVQFLKHANKIYIFEAGRVVDYDRYENFANMHFVDNVSTKSESMDIVSLKKQELQTKTEELYDKNSTTIQIWKDYIRASGHWTYVCLLIGFFLFWQALVGFLDCFVTLWVNIEQKALESNFFDRLNFLTFFSIILVVLVIGSHITSGFFVFCTQNISKNLHHQMLRKIVLGTMTFFHQNSPGRILNRFTKDVRLIDEVLPLNLKSFITVTLQIITNLLIIIYSSYWTIFPAILLIGLSFCSSRLFYKTNRNLKRTEAITRSAVSNHLSASIQGLTTIHTFKVQDTITEEFDRHQDIHSSALYIYSTVYGAFGFWTDMSCVLYYGLVILCFLLQTAPNVGNVGLAITQSASLLGLIQHTTKQWNQLEANMISVERVVEYTKLTPEKDTSVNRPQKQWPKFGNISFHGVCLQYSPNESMALKHIFLKIEGGEKIGIVGKTGAGKTSLTSVLCRLFDFEGVIYIDGVDTKSVPLSTLRSKISVIPQEPVLFFGTVRKNIDPFDNFSDDQIWNCLEELKLKEVVTNLDMEVSDRGLNFSVGQRQLICLARTLLRNNRIIVLDEATANVDLRTDEIIQTTIRRKFRNCTVLTIAHRLSTVIDSDKILVLEDGFVREFGHPFQLLQDPKGVFYRYVKEYGRGMMSKFIETAEASFNFYSA